MHPEVTVVIPTKDRPKLLAATVTTVLEQTDVQVRVVVVDDGGCLPAAQGLPEDARIHVLRKERSGGVSAARNSGLELVETPWVAFLDDDDLWHPAKLARQLEAMRGSLCRWACSASASFTDREVLDVVDPPPEDDVSAHLLHGNVIPAGGSGVLVETALVREVGGFDPDLSVLADWDCWLRLAQRSPVARISATDIGYRVHTGGMAHNVARQQRELEAMQAKYLADVPPLRLDPDADNRMYQAQVAYRSGAWRAGLARTASLLVHDRRLDALATPVRHLLPAAVQRQVRARRLAARARRRPDQDWTWLSQTALTMRP